MRFPFFFTAAIGLSFVLFAQQQPGTLSRAELEKQRQQLMESIRETQEQLAATKNDQKATLGQLRALQAKLDTRQRLIANINADISGIDNSIVSSGNEITQLENVLQLQRLRYAQSVRYAYKHRNQFNTLAFLFSASDYNDAVRRMKYLKKYREYRSHQVDQIRNTQGQIKTKIGVLNTQKGQKNLLLTSEQQQKEQLQQDADQTNQVVAQLKTREGDLAAQISKSRAAARRVDDQITKIIQREIEMARRKAEEEERKRREEEQRKAQAAAAAQQNQQYGARLAGTPGTNPTTNPSNPNTKPAGIKPATNPNTNPASNNNAANNNRPTITERRVNEAPSYKMSLSPQVVALSNSFEANRGKLPWPVDRGFIAIKYGPYKNPLEERVTEYNYGVTFSTTANAVVHAAFDGKVTSTVFIAGAGWMVLISHGQYFTAYSGLASVSVKKDQEVKFKQAIGAAGENYEGTPTMTFQVWKVGSNNKTSTVDPEPWLGR